MKPSRTGDAPAVRIEAEDECAWCGGQRLQLMPRAFAVLRHLVDHAGRLITKEELLTRVWRDAIVSEAALTTCIRDLRKALGDSPDAPRYIETVHRRGFRFIGPIAGATTPRITRASTDARVEPGASPATPTLVGRDTELGRLHELLGRALDGQRQVVFVTGEPGIGKTALVEAFLTRSGLPETLSIGRGRCVEQYGAGEAYLPVLEALGRLGRGPRGDQLVHVLRQHAPTWPTAPARARGHRRVEPPARRRCARAGGDGVRAWAGPHLFGVIRYFSPVACLA